jgi:hypothetical protein
LRAHLKFILPIAGIFALLVLYTAYWFFAAGQVNEAVLDWIEEKESVGYQIAYSELEVRGFPYRFQIEIAGADITAPRSDGGWNATLEHVQANALPYDFSHWIVSFAGPMHVRSDRELMLNAQDARVSLRTNEYGETVRVGAELTALSIETLAGDPVNVEYVESFVLGGAVEDTDSLRVRVEANGVRASDTEASQDLTRAFGTTGDQVRLDFEVTEWAALARDGDAGQWSRAGGQLQIHDALLDWGPAQLAGEGELSLDDEAQPDGRLSMRIADPDSLALALVNADLIPEENEEALRLAAMMAPRGPEGVSLGFRLRDGGIYLGPIRIGRVAE